MVGAPALIAQLDNAGRLGQEIRFVLVPLDQAVNIGQIAGGVLHHPLKRGNHCINTMSSIVWGSISFLLCSPRVVSCLILICTLRASKLVK